MKTESGRGVYMRVTGMVLGVLTCASVLLPWVYLVGGVRTTTLSGLDAERLAPRIVPIGAYIVLAMGMIGIAVAALGRNTVTTVFYAFQLAVGLWNMFFFGLQVAYECELVAGPGVYLPAAIALVWMLCFTAFTVLKKRVERKVSGADSE